MSVRGVGAEGLSISAGGATGAVSSLVFSNSPTVSFGLNGSTLTASAAGGGGGLTNINISAGTTSSNVSAVTFSNANGLSFGYDGSNVTGSYTVPTQSNQTGAIYILTSTNGQSSSSTFDIRSLSITFQSAGLLSGGWTNGTLQLGARFNVSGGTTSQNVSALTFSNSNGVSFGLNGSTLTGSVATSLTNVNVSAGTTSNNLSAFVLSNSNNVSFGLNGSTVTATATFAQTVDTLGIYNSSQTTGQSSSSTYDARSLSIVYSGNISGGWTNSSLLLNVTTAAQTNQTGGIYITAQSTAQSSSSTYDLRTLSMVGDGIVSIGWSNSTLRVSATQSNQAFSAQGGSSAFQTLSFTNSNNVSFSNTGGSVWGSYALNVSAGGGTSNALSAITFTNSNGVSFGLSTGAGVGTMTASIATTYAGTGYTSGTTTGAQNGTLNTAGLSEVIPYLTRYIWPPAQLIAVTAPGGASESIQYVAVPTPITGSRIDALLAMSNSSSAGAGTVTIQFSQYAIIYTRNVSTLSSLSSGSTQTTYTYASNTAGATYLTNSAIYPLSVPINFSLEPGEYFVGFNFVTSTTAASVTMSMVGGNDIQTANNYVEFANTATSTNLYAGMGVYSAATTGVVTRVSLSAINQTGSALSAANIALVFRNG